MMGLVTRTLTRASFDEVVKYVSVGLAALAGACTPLNVACALCPVPVPCALWSQSQVSVSVSGLRSQYPGPGPRRVVGPRLVCGGL